MAEKSNERDFFTQLGIGVSSLTFGVALSIFIYSVASGIVSGVSAWLLFLTSFLLMIRFWWRYNELFVRHIPSHTFFQFMLDFLISFAGIAAVLFVNNIQTWALAGIAAMIFSAIRAGLSWREAAVESTGKLKRTFFGSIGMLVIFAVTYLIAPAVETLTLSAALFVIVAIFVVYSARKP